MLLNPQQRTLLLDLLRPNEARQLAQLLSVDMSEPYASLKALRLTNGSRRENDFLAFFGLPAAPAAETPVVPQTIDVSPLFSLFPHQRRASELVSRILRSDNRRVVLHMPTGSGKTRTAMSVIADHLRQVEPGLVIWLAYSEELCEQAAAEFERGWHALGNRPIPLHRFWGGMTTLDSTVVREGILVAGLSKMYSLALKDIFTLGQIGSRCTLVVMDEAHQAIAETYRLVLEALTAHGKAPGLLGLTATPGRTWSDIDVDEQLARFFAKQKVMLSVEGYANPVNYLVDEGYLARARFQPLLVTNGFTLTSADVKQLEQSLDIPAGVLRRLADDEQRTLAIVSRLEALTKSHSRILFFATTVDHSDLVATVLQARTFDAFSVTGRTSSADRAGRIARFRSDDARPMILCNYGVLTAGFDVPRTSAVLIARPTKSLVLYSQMVGRALRGPRAGGNETAEVVTVVDSSLAGFRDTAEAFTNWEDVWE
jgi:superfamily II DNA or RNA helicase